MDVRYIRKYKNKDDCPINIVRMAHLKEVPSILPGSVSCIKFSSSFNNTDDSFSMCLKDQNEAQQILESFQKFQICRMGGTLQKYDPVKVDEIIKGTCFDIPTSHQEDPSNPFKDTVKKDGKHVPRVNVKALKDFFKKQLIESGVRKFNIIYFIYSSKSMIN